MRQIRRKVQLPNSWSKLNCRRLGIALLLSLGVPGCSAEPQSHPLNTGSIPADARVLSKCSPTGEMACSAWSLLHGDAAAERRPACAAYIDRNGHRVEMCGSLPASLP
jgi:hypothetical protein